MEQQLKTEQPLCAHCKEPIEVSAFGSARHINEPVPMAPTPMFPQGWRCESPAVECDC